ncbi:MAG: hypothetical protein LBE78_06085, partial [Burkholderiaceae bacterium]|nr:hypothetical protein [Burkholderiaceae bacterium]
MTAPVSVCLALALLPLAAGASANTGLDAARGDTAAVTGSVLAPRQPLTFTQISANANHSCAIAANGQAYCWGANNSGQLGNGTTADSPSPVAVDTTGALASKTIRQIAPLNSLGTCVIASDDQVYCWGANGDAGSLVPVAIDTNGVLTGKTIRQIAGGGSHACVIASDDQAYCWGYNGGGRLGNGNAEGGYSPTPVAVDTTGALAGKTIRQIAAGGTHTCVIASDDQAYCWGLNSAGQLGNGAVAYSPTPVAVDANGALAGKTIRQIAAGYYHTCAIASDDQAYCWGQNSLGQLGDGVFDAGAPARAVNASQLAHRTIRQITAGDFHTCALASDGWAYCWGYNDNGQLGIDTAVLSNPSPYPVSTPNELMGKT